MVLTRFLFQDNLKKIEFFKEIFLLVNTSIEVVLRIFFLSLINAHINFAKLGNLTWKSYITAKALSTTSQVELINKRAFAKTALDENSKTFVIHVIVFEAIKIVDIAIYLL